MKSLGLVDAMTEATFSKLRFELNDIKAAGTPPVSAEGEDLAGQATSMPPQSPAVVGSDQGGAIDGFTQGAARASRLLLAEELAVNLLTLGQRGTVRRRVSPRFNRNIVLDAVVTNGDLIRVIEVKYTTNGKLPVDKYKSSIDDIVLYYEGLDDQLKSGFAVDLIIITEEILPIQVQVKIKVDIDLANSAAPFPVRVHIYAVEDLKRMVEFGEPAFA
ncbi:hypothetical protein ASD54_03645 [Rhizobium sp. Root149]|uniref:hypothetical protein n=1 Tax=Rhizobium sp. Root149 TaxID=1736473 RepID=UPI0007152D0E|nr:hypothetical protein [Rhizobium sp. Root149]KQZ54449.1 hypothetical protein ASD54_03645 [Rhizobium sp. Root149]